jgi:capsule biosynthesis phosphatase
MNIIIPIGGSGKRFKDEGYRFPKPLVKAIGKPVLFWLLENLKTKPEDRVFIVYREEFEDYSFSSLIKRSFPGLNKSFIPINYETRGASETTLAALNSMSDDELSKQTIVVDSDSFFNDDIIGSSKQIGGNVIFYFNDDDEQPIFSYIKTDSAGIVLDIREKEKISSNACAGAYCFESGSILRDSILEVIRQEIKQKNEFYISNVYSFMLSKNMIISSSLVSDFKCLGTPNQLKSFCSNFNRSSKKLRVCFDLDNTLVSYPDVEGDYSTVRPIDKNIRMLKNLKQAGHEIIIHTARRMKTHKGNSAKVVADIGRLTIDTMEKFGIEYDELYFGKPYADFYIDDLSVSAYDDLEREIGFYDVHPDARSHNSIEVQDTFVVKRSEKLTGEKYWYQNIPKGIENFFPKPIEIGENHIKLEKINGLTFSYLYTNLILTEKHLRTLVSGLTIIHSSNRGVYSKELYENYLPKFEKRLSQYDYYGHFPDFQEVRDKITHFFQEYEGHELARSTVVHGDPVFSNIFWDDKDKIRMIDMRGMNGDTPSIFGDAIYDYAKVYQSICGYDFILTGRKRDEVYIADMKKKFELIMAEKFGDSTLILRHITASLLISLIPLHNDEKCSRYYELAKDILKNA